jgi:signal transduction histidine kinase
MTGKREIRVLLIEDDEDDYKIIKDTLSDISHTEFVLDWAAEMDGLPEKTRNQEYDVCLMDYRLGEITGIELMKDLTEKGFDIPFILLTGYGDHDIDVLAMKSGAADYLEKGRIYPGKLERSIRYALERKRHMDALRVSEQRLHALSAKLVEAQENERKRVAKEIHDGIGSNLVAIKYALESISTRMRQNRPFREGISIEQVVEYVKDTIEEAQRISSDLRPSVLDDMGLGAAVRWICRRYREFYPDIRILERIEPEELDVDVSLKVVVFRVIQEALNNIAKHSRADAVHLKIQKIDEKLRLSVRDNGRGFEPGEESDKYAEGGLGLMGMRERIEFSGGSLNIITGKGKGCVIRAAWPLDAFCKG